MGDESLPRIHIAEKWWDITRILRHQLAVTRPHQMVYPHDVSHKSPLRKIKSAYELIEIIVHSFK